MSVWIEGNLLLERDCPRCKGGGIDPIRTGFGGVHVDGYVDPDWCSDCGGGGVECVDLACLLLNLWVAIGLAAAAQEATAEAEKGRATELDEAYDNGYRDCDMGRI